MSVFCSISKVIADLNRVPCTCSLYNATNRVSDAKKQISLNVHANMSKQNHMIRNKQENESMQSENETIANQRMYTITNNTEQCTIL